MLGRRNKATIKSRVCRCPCADSPHRLPIAALVVGVAKTQRQHAQPRSREVRIAKEPKAASQHKRLRDFLPYVHAGDKGVENPCLVGIGACATSRHWSRALQALGHTVRLMPAAYVKPFLKRQKNDAVDAEAICEAVVRPNMRQSLDDACTIGNVAVLVHHLLAID